MTPRSAVASPVAGVVAAWVAMVAHFVRLHVTATRSLVFEDQAILWDFARDLRRGTFRQLDFPGQFYDSSLEAVPAAGLGALGLSDSDAYSLGMLGVTLLAWSAMGVAVHRRRQPLLAVAVLLVPVAMTIDNSLVSLMWATAIPRVMAVIVAAVVIGSQRPSLRWVVLVAVGGCAVLLDSSTLLLIVPVGVWLARRDFPDIPWRTVAVSAVAPVVVALGRELHHRANPALDFHPGHEFGFGIKPIRWHLQNPTRSLREYGPELFHIPVLRTAAVVLVLAAVALLIVRQADRAARWSLVAAGVIGFAYYASHASLRSVESLTPLPSAGRGVMALPFLVVFLAAVARPSERMQARVVAAMVVLAVGGFVHGLMADSADEFVESVQAAGVMELVEVSVVEARCDDLAAVVNAETSPVVLSSSRVTAWACSALLEDSFGPDVTVLFPTYERRVWELKRFWSAPQTSWVVWGGGLGGCDAVSEAVACGVPRQDIAVMRTPEWRIDQTAWGSGLGMRWLPDGFPDD